MRNRPVRHAVEHAVFQILRGLVRALPHPAARHLGAALGSLAHAVAGGRRRTARRNLASAFPDSDERQVRRWTRGAFRNLTSQALDLLSQERFDAISLCRLLSFEGWHHLEARSPDGRPAIVMTGHLGFWEVLGNPLALYKGGVWAVARPLDNPKLERVIQSMRCRFGNTMIAKRGAARGMTRALRDGQRMLILIDQRPGRDERLTVEFFGRPAFTSPLLARLALRYRMPVVPIFALPEPRGRYRIVAREPIVPAEDDDDASLTHRYLAAIEAEIRRAPERWMWMHDRWRGA